MDDEPRNLPRVVTLGGGHGQANVLAALRQLRVQPSAVVSVSDDGGCSGRLRVRPGVPPPGDLRRCLSALARRRGLAERFEQRISPGDGGPRCAGNLVLALAYERLGSLQAAVDWAGKLLSACGRVLPVSENAGVLLVYDAKGRVVAGESRVEELGCVPMVAGVHGPEAANPEAVAAITRADLLLIGPGSFFTSTLAAVTTAGIAEALIKSDARCCYVANLADEGRQTRGWPLESYVRILRDHLTINSLGGEPRLEVLVHRPGSCDRSELADGTRVRGAPIAQPGAKVHDPGLLAEALGRCFGFEPREGPATMTAQDLNAERLFEQELAAAWARYVSQSASEGGLTEGLCNGSV
jgi:uncharacterized cofD-like protein